MISVVIPAYNHRDYILCAIESAFAQHVDCEIIVVNDGSPDDTRDVLRPLIESGRIRYFEQPNAGAAAARNLGLEAANGEFIAFLDDDDVWPEGKLERQLELMRQNPEVVMVYGDEVVLKPDGSLGKHRGINKPSGDAFIQFLKRNWITSLGQTLMRTDAVRSAGGFDPSIRYSDDWELYLRLAKVGPFLHEPRVTLYYRMHDANASWEAVPHVRNHFKVMRKHMGQHLRLIGPHLRLVANYYVQNLIKSSLAARSRGRYGAALNAQLHALLLRPALLIRPGFLYCLVANMVRLPPRQREYEPLREFFRRHSVSGCRKPASVEKVAPDTGIQKLPFTRAIASRQEQAVRYVLKPMDIGEVLDQAIQLLRNHYKTFLTITLLMYAPVSLVMHVAQYIYLENNLVAEPTTPEEFQAMFDTAIIGFALSIGLLFIQLLIAYPITVAAMIRAVSDEYLDQPTNAVKSFKTALPVALPLILTSFIQGMVVMVGTCFCVIPGIYLFIRYWLTNYVVVLENTYYIDAMKRSWNLMEGKGHMLTAFVLVLVLGVITTMASAIAQIIPVPFISLPLLAIVESVSLILGAAVGVVFYFSCRCSVEQFDIQLLAQAVGYNDYRAQNQYDEQFQTSPSLHGQYMQGAYYQQYPEGYQPIAGQLQAAPQYPGQYPQQYPPYPPAPAPPTEYGGNQWQQQYQAPQPPDENQAYPPPPPAE